MAAALPLPALADLQLQTSRYLCDRGVELPAAYVSDASSGIVTLTAEGRQISLYQQEAASGVRYGWPSDGSNYVWLTKGTLATLLWRDGATKTEITLLSCQAQ